MSWLFGGNPINSLTDDQRKYLKNDMRINLSSNDSKLITPDMAENMIKANKERKVAAATNISRARRKIVNERNERYKAYVKEKAEEHYNDIVEAGFLMLLLVISIILNIIIFALNISTSTSTTKYNEKYWVISKSISLCLNIVIILQMLKDPPKGDSLFYVNGLCAIVVFFTAFNTLWRIGQPYMKHEELMDRESGDEADCSLYTIIKSDDNRKCDDYVLSIGHYVNVIHIILLICILCYVVYTLYIR